MKKLILIGAVVVSSLLLVGCTENIRARNWGGNLTIEAPAGKTVVNMTWKEQQLWIQYRDRKPNENPSVTVFKEHSSFGLMEGSVTVIEK